VTDALGRHDPLELRCTRCARAGHYRVAGLVERFGADMLLVNLRRRLAADCPRASAMDYERCDPFYPQLSPEGAAKTA
jgi:hypothetical protein